MAKIFVTGAGSAQSNGVINCLLMDHKSNDEIVGLGSDQYDLMLCKAQKKILLPHSTKSDYKEKLLKVLNTEKPDMIHFQHDKELFVASSFRDEISATGVKFLIPDNNTIDTCVHKYKSWKKFKDYGLKVPENIVINTKQDLKCAFKELGNVDGKIWLRSMSIGGGGKGALPTNDFDTAVDWINNSEGWGDFVAAELLTKKTVTWLSIWYKGELIVAQGRRRVGWAHSSLSPSGVTGVTKVGETYANSIVDEVGQKACKAVSQQPNGIFGVDMAYDKDGIPNPTEINIGRFFTTVEFFAQAGLNFPVILKNLCIFGKKPELSRKLNPLPDGLLWLRAMDVAPLLTTREEIKRRLIKV